MTIIRDGDNKVRKVKNLKLIQYDLPGGLGNMDELDVPCVEYLVIGNSSDWVDWMRQDIFEVLNPKVEIK
jgi:hypothetical protein